MEENKLLYDLDGNSIPKYTDECKKEPSKEQDIKRPPKQSAKRRKLYKTSGI